MSNSQNRYKPALAIFREFAGEFVDLLFGNVWNKVGLSILLFVIAMACMLSPVVGLDGEPIDNPDTFYVVGAVLILISICLIAKRWKELKEKSNS